MDANNVSPHPGYTPIASSIINYPLWADKLVSLIPVNYSKDYYFDKSAVEVINDNNLASEEGEVVQIEREKNKVYYSVQDRGYKTFIGRRTEMAGNQQNFDEVQESVSDLSHLNRARHEKRAGLLLRTDANYNANMLRTGGGDFVKWVLPNTGDPLTDMYYLITRLGPFDPVLMQLNIGIGVTAWDVIVQHTKILDALKYTTATGRAGADDLKMLLSKEYPVDNLVKLQSFLQTRAGTATNIWSDDEVYVTVTQRGAPDRTKTSYAACFRQNIDGGQDGAAVYITPTGQGAHGGTEVKVSVSETFQIIDKKYGGRLKDAV